MTLLLQILTQIGKSVIMAFLTEAFIKALVIHFLEFLAKKTTNTVDNDLVRVVKEALYPKSEKDSEAERN